MVCFDEISANRNDDARSGGGSREKEGGGGDTKRLASNYSSGSSIVPVCVRREYPHYSGNRHYSACCHYWLFLPMPCDFTGTIAGNRHYSTGTIEGPLLCEFGDVALTSQHENQGQRHISMSAPGQVTPDESAQTQKRNTLPLRFMYAVGLIALRYIVRFRPSLGPGGRGKARDHGFLSTQVDQRATQCLRPHPARQKRSTIQIYSLHIAFEKFPGPWWL